MKEALEWWNSMTDSGRASFPHPATNEDILAYYNSPSGFVLPAKIKY